MIDQPSFTSFYTALNCRSPFPWQERLANSLASDDCWPSEIGVPTGMGKTACLDIAIWWLASQADRSPDLRTAPTRIWWLVNRRLLVDATAEHAERVAEELAESRGGEPVAAVATRLQSLSADPAGPPLQIVRLRGGAATGRPTDPSQPAVVLSTLPMYGSRLLFRGYGSSRSMRPIDAALAGTDSLVLVDEAHLAHHLMRLFDPLAACDRAGVDVLSPARLRPVVVSLTATGSAGAEGRFDLDAADHANEVVSQRLSARKPVEIIEMSPKADSARTMAAAAADLLAERGRPASCLVFTNTPSSARSVADAIMKRFVPDTIDLVVVTGRQRDRESGSARRRVLDTEQGAPAMRPAGPRQRHLVVVATQTLEVGADLDFEYCVTEACGVRALTQRLGRLNRLGRFDHAAGVYVHAEPLARGDAEPSWPVYGTEPLTVLQRLKDNLHNGTVNLSPLAIAEVLGPPGDDPGRAPEVLPALLWEWVKTTCPPTGEAPVEPYFSGLAEPTRRVSVCWRAHVPTPDDAIEKLWPRVTDKEVIDLPLHEAREAFEGWPSVNRMTSDRTTVECVAPDDLRPGDTVVLSVDAGLLDEHGWNPAAREVVADDSLGVRGIPLEARALAGLVRHVPGRELAAVLENEDPDASAELLTNLIAGLAQADPIALSAAEWEELIANLDIERGVVTPRGEVPRLAVRGAEAQVRLDELDELCASSAAVDLDAHGEGVGARARAVARALGLTARLVDTVARSALFHDAGKADVRFQRWLDPQANAPGLLAKSTTSSNQWEAARIASGWPRGGRHEDLSARLVTAWLNRQPTAALEDVDPDLLVHLVVSHHGHARPFLLPVEDDTSQPLTGRLEDEELTVDADLSRPDWDQPDRFFRLNQRYGHWGVALLESIVRQSDHAVSAGSCAGSDQGVL